tara:strand:- start:494 stop:2092 length:1599 start_codon:yes stop_codon:yes gene_type:complete
MKKINVLDCTLRDGGYYNNWDFSSELIQDYINAISNSGIKYLELGFRSFSNKSFKGSNWYTTDSFINSLKIPKNIKLAVMLNASQITSNNISGSVKKLFLKKKKSKVIMVRIAAHFHEFEKSLQISKILQTMGYLTAINLMQISEISEEDLLKVSKKLNDYNPDIFYFADSLGSLEPNDVKKIIKNLSRYWNGELGIHAHDNLSKAILNTKEAIKHGVKWADSTITGMGRGAGNVQTEYFLVELQNDHSIKFKILPILNLIDKHFKKLKYKYNWGTNTYYYLAGKHRIHPTYIQEMLSTHFADAEILAAINQLKDSGGSKYNADLVKSEFQGNINLNNGTWKPEKNIKKKEVLLIASGPNLKDYRNQIENYIAQNKPYVIAVNTDIKINKKFIDIYAACNPLKLIANYNEYKKLKKPLAVPNSLINKNLKKHFKKLKILNFGVGLKQNSFKFKKNGAILPRLYTLVYALSIATSGNAKRVLLAGFDGYGPLDVRTKIIDELLHLYSSSEGAKSLLAVTPTTYSVGSSSIYAI